MKSIRPEGVWEIVSATPEKNSHRQNRFVCFPWVVCTGVPASWVYVNYITLDKKGGSSTITSYVEDISVNDNKQIEIKTENSLYIFEQRLTSSDNYFRHS